MSFEERLQVDQPVVWHHGVYKKTQSVSSAVFMITGMSIGAGALGLPYVVAQVGLKIGLVYILVLGLIMMFLNLMIGEVAERTKEPMHIPGFAGKYLSPNARRLVSLMIILSSFGSLLAYLIGEGSVLAEFFGGNQVWWGVLFWSVTSVLIWRGLETVKVIEKIISLIVIFLMTGLSFYLLKDFNSVNLGYVNWRSIFLPYGVILFSLSATPAIAEAHALLPGDSAKFKKAIIIGSLIPIILYMLFALAVVGVTGFDTTGVATIGIGIKMGKGALIVGNIFAALAMFTCYIGMGVSLKQSLIWDNKINPLLAFFAVVSAPLILFLLGLRNFVTVLDFVGGFFTGIQAIIMVLIYLRAKEKGDLDPGKMNLHHAWLLLVPVFLAFTFFTIYSIFKMF